MLYQKVKVKVKLHSCLSKYNAVETNSLLKHQAMRYRNHSHKNYCILPML